jgi:hypothetical protein
VTQADRRDIRKPSWPNAIAPACNRSRSRSLGELLVQLEGEAQEDRHERLEWCALIGVLTVLAAIVWMMVP